MEKFVPWGKEKVNELKENMRAGAGAAGVGARGSKNLYFVAYISKSPITGYFQHPTLNERGGISPQDYYQGYKNMLIAVRSVDIKGTCVYNNRGICKGLVHCIKGGYGPLSVFLQGFTAVFFKYYRGKTHMSVAPLPGMYRILQKAVGSDVILEGENIPEALNHFVGITGLDDKKCVVPCEALIKCFCESQTKP